MDRVDKRIAQLKASMQRRRAQRRHTVVQSPEYQEYVATNSVQILQDAPPAPGLPGIPRGRLIHALRQSTALQQPDLVLPYVDEYQRQYGLAYSRRQRALTSMHNSGLMAVPSTLDRPVTDYNGTRPLYPAHLQAINTLIGNQNRPYLEDATLAYLYGTYRAFQGIAPYVNGRQIPTDLSQEEQHLG